MLKFLTTFFLVISAGSAMAQFQPTQGKLFIDYPELEESYTPGSEFVVHAIVPESSSRVIYVISRMWRDQTFPFGAFECGTEFTYMDSFSSGYRDIFCVTKDGLNNRISSILRVPNNGGYEQFFQ